jgi:transcriptional regulator with XRE-family HTH domain
MVVRADDSSSSSGRAEYLRRTVQKAIDLCEQRGQPVPPHALAAIKNPWSKPSENGIVALGPGAARMSDVDGREVVRCEHCQFIQFRRREDICDRCRASFGHQPYQPERVDRVAVVLPFASRIREIRTKMRMTEDELGRTIGKSSNYVSQIEAGLIVPSLEQLEKLADALRVGGSELFQVQEAEPISDYIFADVSAELTHLVVRFPESDRQQLWREWHYRPNLRKL